ncbi:MAG: hypothetical protein JZU65_01160, partial [Chlorobium sp.]|nr:hypothetical protein [Chlorobium sp.]
LAARPLELYCCSWDEQPAFRCLRHLFWNVETMVMSRPKNPLADYNCATNGIEGTVFFATVCKSHSVPGVWCLASSGLDIVSAQGFFDLTDRHLLPVEDAGGKCGFGISFLEDFNKMLG